MDQRLWSLSSGKNGLRHGDRAKWAGKKKTSPKTSGARRDGAKQHGRRGIKNENKLSTVRPGRVKREYYYCSTLSEYILFIICYTLCCCTANGAYYKGGGNGGGGGGCCCDSINGISRRRRTGNKTSTGGKKK